ncbi:hypothetical protein BJ165DRAFT_1530875 [Panaeolus papilionaceus]|nr:hypothetical protein BJ165DRAFT_1530875 [Panaeolus papilionaceus]
MKLSYSTIISVVVLFLPVHSLASPMDMGGMSDIAARVTCPDGEFFCNFAGTCLSDSLRGECKPSKGSSRAD